MRWSRLLVALGATLLGFAQAQTSKASSEEKAAELEAKSQVTPVIDMTAADYNRYLIGNRDYGVVAMFTALQPNRRCQLCKEAQFEFISAAKSFRSAGHRGVYFVLFDYDSAAKVFNKHDVNSAPLVWYFPAKGKPTKQDKMEDLYRRGARAELFAKFISDRTGMHFQISRPINWTNLITLVGVVSAVVYLAVTFFPMALFLKFANPVLCIISMLLALLFTGGYMWNQIRGAGMYTRDGAGKTVVFAGSGSQTQTETMTVMLLNGVTALGLILAIEAQKRKIPYVPKDLVAVIAFLVAIAALGVHMYVYRIYKNGGYPFKLIF
eukprot:comp12857_c0_seq1/m.8027 comp12857_c0_seq1/g.8027  ORF comp12857_c0_seq1/g.8027 comp12857_c0_seq1/m.8027 type:complete len:323 (-) comp12857_c0_seq1:117-1085(-)